MRTLVIGITGFVGSHLADFLVRKNNCEVYGLDKPNSNNVNIQHLKEHIKLFDCDITDFQSVKSIFREIKPDNIFHLAAIGAGSDSLKNPKQILYNNIIGELNILEVAKLMDMEIKIHISGSSEEYGKTYSDELPIVETKVLRPLSPYALSKVSQTLLGYQYFENFSMNIFLTRAFNHTGPRQNGNFVCSSFAKQIAEIEFGLKKPVINVGNLDIAKDFCDVRDIVRAYWLLLEKCLQGEIYNICSGKSIKINDILEILLGFSKENNIKINKKDVLLRPYRTTNIYGNYSKFNKITGWTPQYSIEETLFDILKFWREYYTIF